jgi:peptidyl-prolyl cis-trans isomerase A (cyclophilin A)
MKFGRVRQNYFKAFWIYVIALLLLGLTFHSEAKDAKPKVDKEPVVVISTSMGDITVKLNNEKAPISTKNFLAYVDKKQYDGTIFHRVIKEFMIQGGGFTPDMKEKPTMAPIENEAKKSGLSNKRGTIAMARTSSINSATSQFFINVVDNTKLDYRSDDDFGYAVFGEVTSGMDVVDKIRQVTTVSKGDYSDVPAQTILIKSIRLGK